MGLRPALNGGVPAPAATTDAMGICPGARCLQRRSCEQVVLLQLRRSGKDFLQMARSGSSVTQSLSHGHADFVWPSRSAAEGLRPKCSARAARAPRGRRGHGHHGTARRCRSAVVAPSEEEAWPAATLLSLAADYLDHRRLPGAAATALEGMQGVQPACLPVWLPFWWAPSDTDAEEDDAGTGLSATRASLLRACYVQALVGALDCLVHDPMSGLITCGVAALGMQASTTRGGSYLPGYVVLAFCNGSMQVLLGLEGMARQGAVVSSLAMASTSTKLAAGIAVASPATMFAGLMLACCFHRELVAQHPRFSEDDAAMAAASDNLPPVNVAGGESRRWPQGVQQQGQEGGGSSSLWRPFSGATHRLENHRDARL